MNIQENIPLAPLTGFKAGGPASYYAVINNLSELEKALAFTKEKSVPFFVLGDGTNILVSDEGFKGLVIQTNIHGIERIEETDSEVILKVGAGENWDYVVHTTVDAGLWGIENLSLIPGKTGGVPVQNVGAYGAEIKSLITEVEVYDTLENQVKKLSNAECAFRYRASRFNNEDKGRFVVLTVTFKLAKTSTPNMNYPDVRRYFETKNITTPTLQEMRQAIVDIRTYKLPDPKILGNAGSFFKNPVIGREEFEKMKPAVISEREKRENCCKDPWYWEQPDGTVKVSAACIMHIADFVPGHRAGRVGIAPRQPLVLVNYENGTAKEIVELANSIRQKVFIMTGIELQAEPELVGFSKNPFTPLS